MTNKIEITDEMADRAEIALLDGGLMARGQTARQHARYILELALNPPSVPEVEVTEKMLEVAQIAYCTAQQFNPKAKSCNRIPHVDEMHAAIYRAMHAAAPECDHSWIVGRFVRNTEYADLNIYRCHKCGMTK